MAKTRLPLSYTCQEQNKLMGSDGDVVRYCDTCRIDVVDFRQLTEQEQDSYMALAHEAGESVCASQQPERGHGDYRSSLPTEPCRGGPDPGRPPPPVAGRIAPPAPISNAHSSGHLVIREIEAPDPKQDQEEARREADRAARQCEEVERELARHREGMNKLWWFLRSERSKLTLKSSIEYEIERKRKERVAVARSKMSEILEAAKKR